MNEAPASIDISISAQALSLRAGGSFTRTYPVSTASNGPGQQFGSECTPVGRHIIRACIGNGAPLNTVFVGRRPTGEIYSQRLGREQPDRDWILTRILWLSGMQPGLNRLGNVDTMRRYIYIHGTPYEAQLGTPASRGCIRMRSTDIIELFRQAPAGTPVNIHN